MKWSIAVVTVALIGCASHPITLPDDPPGMTGSIIARDVSAPISEGRPTIHVKADVSDECGTIFVISPETLIARRVQGDGFERAPASELEVGRTVRVWADYELRSCSAQSEARVIELVNL